MVQAVGDHSASVEMSTAFKEQLKRWRGFGIKSLRNIFKSVGGPLVNREQLVTAATNFGLSAESIDNFEGTIDSDAFLRSLREPLHERSTILLNKIWEFLDINEQGYTNRDKIAERFDSRRFSGGSEYVGKYSDPNHAGGFRIITLLD